MAKSVPLSDSRFILTVWTLAIDKSDVIRLSFDFMNARCNVPMHSFRFLNHSIPKSSHISLTNASNSNLFHRFVRFRGWSRVFCRSFRSHVRAKGEWVGVQKMPNNVALWPQTNCESMLSERRTRSSGVRFLWKTLGLGARLGKGVTVSGTESNLNFHVLLF